MLHRTLHSSVGRVVGRRSIYTSECSWLGLEAQSLPQFTAPNQPPSHAAWRKVGRGREQDFSPILFSHSLSLATTHCLSSQMRWKNKDVAMMLRATDSREPNWTRLSDLVNSSYLEGKDKHI